MKKSSKIFARDLIFGLSRDLPLEGGIFLPRTLTTEYTFIRHIPCVGVVSPKPSCRCAETTLRSTSDCSEAAKAGLLPAETITGTGDNDTSVQSQPPNGDHAMRAADRDPAGGERPMELPANSRLMISRKRGSRKNSSKNKTTKQRGKSALLEKIRK